MPLHLIVPSLPFEIWEIDFAGPLPERAKHLRSRYIITIVEYLTKWADEKTIESCTKEVETKLIYENIVT